MSARPETPPLAGCVPWPDELAHRWRALGYWRGETFGSMLRERAAATPDRLALVAGTERFTYRELDDRVDSLVGGLRELGLAAGDRVVVQLGNEAAFVEVVFALLRLGVLPVFALPAHRRREIGHFAEIAEARGLVVSGIPAGDFDARALASDLLGRIPSLAHAIVAGGEPGEHVALDAIRTNDPDREAIDAAGPSPAAFAFLQLSGGSTGVPKLIPRTHDEYLYTLRRSAEVCELDEHSVYMAALPVAHNFPLSSPGIMGAFYAGSRVVLAPDPSPETAFGLIERERVTITGLVPPLAMRWIDAARNRGDDLSSLAVLQVGGAKLTEAAARRVGPELGCRLQQVFGMAEGLVCYTGLHDDEQRIVTTQGRPMAEHDELRVVDDDDRVLPAGSTGSLQTRGPYTIQGYYRAEEHNARAFTSDSWYRTGDVVRVTAEGDVVVEGRDKDQINRGGEKIAAAEIENELLAHPAIHDVAVVAMPDELLGEKSCAFVVARGTPPRKPELRRFVLERGLAAYKVPDRFEFVDELPRTHVGKVSKFVLRDRLRRPAASRPPS